MKLKSRRVFAPGGWRFFQPETGWSPDGGLTFEQTVQAIINHRRANPRFNLPTEQQAVENELDLYTCLRIAGDPNWCEGGDLPGPKSPGLSSPRQWTGRSAAVVVAGAKALVSGINILIDWLGSGGVPVDKELAEQRAEICAGCPQNTKEGVAMSWFTQPASELIRKQLEIRKELTLATAYDDKLGVCAACYCPLKLKTWTPLSHILEHLKPEQSAALDARCWINHEGKA